MKKRLLDDLKEAMKEKNEIKKNAIQMTRAGILQIEKDKGIESIIPISIPNNEINFMISSNNDFVFISPGYVKGLNNEQYHEMFEKIVCSS